MGIPAEVGLSLALIVLMALAAWEPSDPHTPTPVQTATVILMALLHPRTLLLLLFLFALVQTARSEVSP
jgi:hypothetical protein